MNPKSSSLAIPFSHQDIQSAIELYGWTPFFLYHEKTILDTCKRLQDAFRNHWFWDFVNHFAVKANPNRHILHILWNAWMWMDCSSASELHSSEVIWLRWEEIMFTSNNTTAEEFEEAKRLNAIINLDDITHIETLESVGLPDIVSCRWNPGDLMQWNNLIWNPKDIKYGMSTEHIIDAYRLLKERWIKRFWLHTMVVTDERRVDALIETAKLLFHLAHQVYLQTWVKFEFINLGWGISVPYRPEQEDVDIAAFVSWVRRYYDEILVANNLWNPQIRMENGRYLTGNAWVYITRAINLSSKHGNRFVGLDGWMQDFPRPGRVKAYHHISVVWKEHAPHDTRQILTWSLCIGSDVFTPAVGSEPQWRNLPEIEKGDIIAIHTAWAHGHATWYNYNWRGRCWEVLIQSHHNAAKIIRFPQTERELHWWVPEL